MVNKAQIISPFLNNPYKVKNPLGASIANAISQDRTMPFSPSYVDGTFQNVLGTEVQKYIANVETREQLAKKIESYF